MAFFISALVILFFVRVLILYKTLRERFYRRGEYDFHMIG